MGKKFRKKPVQVEAFRFGYDKAPEWFEPEWITITSYDSWGVLLAQRGYIPTLEGRMLFITGDYIIRGVAGEVYSCKPSIFKQTYEEVI